MLIKRIKKVTCVTLTMICLFTIVACGKKSEAVISGEEDITDSETQYPTLSDSTAKVFTLDDLSVGKIRYLMSESQVLSILGKPSAIYTAEESGIKTDEITFDEKIYSYNELTLVFMRLDKDNRSVTNQNEGEYKLTAAASIREGDTFSRGLHVGSTLDDILTVYYRDADYMNNYYKTVDGTSVIGQFLYGGYTMEDFETSHITGEAAYAVLNFNGYSGREQAESYIAEFTYFDGNYKSGYASAEDSFGYLAFDLDNNGVVTAIRWYYYPEE